MLDCDGRLHGMERVQMSSLHCGCHLCHSLMHPTAEDCRISSCIMRLFSLMPGVCHAGKPPLGPVLNSHLTPDLPVKAEATPRGPKEGSPLVSLLNFHAWMHLDFRPNAGV